MAAILLLGAGASQAQSAAGSAAQPELWVESRLSTTVGYSSNAQLASEGAGSSQYWELSPGIRVVGNSSRLKGFLDYSLTGKFQSNEDPSTGRTVRHGLNANFNVNAWDERLFVDVGGVVAQQSISAFSPQSASSSLGVNQTQTSSVRLSPYLKGSLGSLANYELRYRVHATDSDAVNYAKVTQDEVSLRLSDQKGALGWSVLASHDNVDRSIGREVQSDQLRGGMSYRLSAQVVARVLAGFEANDQLTLTRKTYSLTGFGADWQPSARTSLNLNREKRYFGTAHRLDFSHRASRTALRFTDSQTVSQTSLDANGASLGALYDLLDNLYTEQEQDPVRRAELVQAELQRLGLAGDTQVSSDYLSSAATVQRNQRFSIALRGIRDTLTLSITRGKSRRLEPGLTLGDDFDLSPVIRQQGWGLVYAHRLTRLTSFSLAVSEQRNRGVAGTLDNQLRSLTASMATRLGPRTTGSMQLRRSLSDSAARPYGETAVSATLSHRF